MTYSKFSPCIKSFIQVWKHNQNILSLRKLSYGGLFFWIKLSIPEVHIYRDANPWKSKFSPEFQLQNYDMGMD